MLNRKLLYIIMSIFPLLILMFLSLYYVNNTWNDYKDNVKLQTMLVQAQKLQTYENTMLDEVLCTLLIQKDSTNSTVLCENKIKESQKLEAKIHLEDDGLQSWKQEISITKKNLLKHGVKDFETVLAIKDGHSSVATYLKQIALNTNNIEKKELLGFYKNISNNHYVTVLEKFLVTYYLSRKEKVSIANSIFWDKLIEASDFPDISETKYLPMIRENFLKIIDSEKLQDTLRKIDEMRITVLTGNMHKSNKNSEWIVLLEKKDKALIDMKSIIIQKFNADISRETSHALWMILFYLSLFIFSLLALVYFYYKYTEERKEERAFLRTVNRIDALSPYDEVESEVMHKMLNDAKNKEDIYTYLYSSYQLLNDKRKQAEDEKEAKGKFLSTLSHEIRTPLSAIIGFSKLLKDLGSTSEQEEFLSLIEGSSKNLISIVNDILDLSKLNAEKMELVNISFSLFETVEATVNTFSHLTNQKDIELGLFIDPFLSHYFLGDSTKLSQILTNLIGNAVKFTEEYGKINIFVQGTHEDDDHMAIKFAVNDSGVGLSAEEIGKIFNPFSQASESTSNKFGGTGLGLSISRDMVELMGGKLEVTSKKESGTTFYFTLALNIDKENTFKKYPHFTDITVGLALPEKNINRQLDTNIETYLRHLGADFSIYYYEDLFESHKILDLPDIMIFDHHYARLAGELEQCASLDCMTVLLTNATLRPRINSERHTFNNIIYTPMTLRKCSHILQTTIVSTDIKSKPLHSLENIESFSGLKVLAVDDNLINRKLIKIILEKIGLNVTLASDGYDAVEKYKASKFNIIFMDIQMPTMDGVEATHNIVKYEKDNNLVHVPIVALTANVAIGDKERYLSEGMDDYATKPLEIDVIKSMISKHCGLE